MTMPKNRPTPEEMDERIVAPEGTTFNDVVEALLNAPPLEEDEEQEQD
jgi:hypothetical protein